MSHDEDRILEELLRGLEDPDRLEPPLDFGDQEARLWREYVELSALLPFALEPVDPSPACRTDVLSQIASTLPFARKSTAVPAPRWLQALAAALVVFVLGLSSFSAWLYRDNQRQGVVLNETRRALEESRQREEFQIASQGDIARLRSLVTAAGTRVCRLKPTGQQPVQSVARGMVYFDPERQEYFLTARDLSPCTEGYAYRLWFMVNGEAVFGSRFNVKAGVPVVVGAGGMPAGATAMWVTYQRDAVEEPSGESVLFGDQSEEML